MAPPPPSNKEIADLVQRELGETPVSITTLRPGAWSSATAVSTPSGEYILRLAQTADDFRCDQFAARFASPRLPIPPVQALGQHGQQWFCISSRMPGIHLDELTAEDMAVTLPTLAEMLIAIREVDSSSTHGFGGWDADGNGSFSSFADQLLDVAIDRPEERGGGWSDVLQQHPYEAGTFDRGVALLQKLCSHVPDTRQLIHMDTINFNVVTQDNKISGIFDWGCAMWGDALYDLAWFRFWNPWYPQWAELNIPDYLQQHVGVHGSHAEERMQCYLLHIGVGHIRYSAFIGNQESMTACAKATEKLACI